MIRLHAHAMRLLCRPRHAEDIAQKYMGAKVHRQHFENINTEKNGI